MVPVIRKARKEAYTLSKRVEDFAAENLLILGGFTGFYLLGKNATQLSKNIAQKFDFKIAFINLAQKLHLTALKIKQFVCILIIFIAISFYLC